MRLYQYILENEFVTYYHYLSYSAEVKDILGILTRNIDQAIDIVDIFPEPKVQKGTTTEPLLVHTASGQEMYLPPGFDITIVGHSRILFQFVEP